MSVSDLQIERGQRWAFYEMGDAGTDLYFYSILVQNVHDGFFVYQDYRDESWGAMTFETFGRFRSQGSVELMDSGLA